MPQSSAEFGLSAGLMRSVAEQGCAHPTPCEAQAILLILAGRDVLAGAQTGTGRSAGFAVPLLPQPCSAPRRGAAADFPIRTGVRQTQHTAGGAWCAIFRINE